jgi:hypothetical protein
MQSPIGFSPMSLPDFLALLAQASFATRWVEEVFKPCIESCGFLRTESEEKKD